MSCKEIRGINHPFLLTSLKGVSHLFTLLLFPLQRAPAIFSPFQSFTFSPLFFPSNFFFRTSILINDCSAIYEERTSGELSALS